jgi:hypothetical protein
MALHRMCQPFTFQGPPKFTHIGIFGLKVYHLATLLYKTKYQSYNVGMRPSGIRSHAFALLQHDLLIQGDITTPSKFPPTLLSHKTQ